MTDVPFDHHRQAALSLLSQFMNLTHKEAGFLGNVCVAEVLSSLQRNWLSKLLDRYGLPHLSEGDSK